MSHTKDSFIILGQQRTGTHLLATLLDSHPNLSVFDEYYSKSNNYMLPVKPIEELDDNEGMIIMYNQMSALDINLDGFKIIHLIRRDKEAQARSHLKIRKGGTVHSKRAVNEDIEVTDDEVESHIKSIKHREKRIKDMNFPDKMTISYEKITGGDEVENIELPEVCSFLGVDNRILSTRLKKINK